MKKTKTGTVGIVGLGTMGGSFARNLKKAGWRVIGFDPAPARQREMTRAGVEIAANMAALAAAAPVIVTSLPKPEALAATAKAVAAEKLPRRILIECSTFTIADKEKAARVLARAGHVLLDCPVSGTGAQARTGDIVAFASGDPRAVARARPVLAAFTRKAYDVGAFGNGSKMKYVANLLVGIHNVASAEALVLGMKAGLDPKMIVDLIPQGAGNSRVFELRAPMMAKNDYRDATASCTIWEKDMAVISGFARKIGAPTPLFDATMPLYAAALRDGRGDEDTAAVCAILEKKARLKRPKSARRRAAR